MGAGACHLPTFAFYSGDMSKMRPGKEVRVYFGCQHATRPHSLPLFFRRRTAPSKTFVMMNVEERALEAIYLHGCHRDGWIGVETEQPTAREKFIAICLHEHGHPQLPNETPRLAQR